MDYRCLVSFFVVPRERSEAMFVFLSHFLATMIGMVTGMILICMIQTSKKRHTSMLNDDA